MIPDPHPPIAYAHRATSAERAIMSALKALSVLGAAAAPGLGGAATGPELVGAVLEEGEEAALSPSFFDGAAYTEKVVEQMSRGAGEFHSFPESVTAFEYNGTVSQITGGDGIARDMLEIPGSYQSATGNWYDGVFQFIKEADGAINHRLFVPTR